MLVRFFFVCEQLRGRLDSKGLLQAFQPLLKICWSAEFKEHWQRPSEVVTGIDIT